MKVTKTKILDYIRKHGEVTVQVLVSHFSVSRQYISRLVGELVRSGKLVRFGSTRKASYLLPEDAVKKSGPEDMRFVRVYTRDNLEEDIVLLEVEDVCTFLKMLPENVHSIFTFAFSEMLNNAIDHSRSVDVMVHVYVERGMLKFMISDNGIGVFLNIMSKRALNSEFEAIKELLKGKLTTMPKQHSGEGIFFTSRVADTFLLDSYGYRLIVDTRNDDIRIEKPQESHQGTLVSFAIDIRTERHLTDVFREYTNQTGESDYGFDKTEVRVGLYTKNGVNVSRSQARRILQGLEKFSIVILDFENVPTIGQAFADEIYRVFKRKHPHVEFREEHMNDVVRFMVERAKTEAARFREVD